MNAREAITLVVEKQTPEGWASTRGVYANLSNWPREVKYYLKCPSCGTVHGDFKTMKEAHARRLCDQCNINAINKLKDEVKEVDDDPQAKVKPMIKLMGEASEPEMFDPFDDPPENEGVPPLPGESPDVSDDPMADIEGLLFKTWVDRSYYELERDASLSHGAHIEKAYGGYEEGEADDIDHYTVKDGNVEYLVFKDDDAAEAMALREVENDLENEPGIFTQDWLVQYIDKEKLKEALGDPYEDWESENVGDLGYVELLEKMVEEGEVDFDDPVFFGKSGNPRIETKARASRLNDAVQRYVEKNKPTLDDPMGWLEDVYGKEDAIKEAFKLAPIDVKEAARDAVKTDGWPHFIARYDGHQNELESGYIYCRTN